MGPCGRSGDRPVVGTMFMLLFLLRILGFWFLLMLLLLLLSQNESGNHTETKSIFQKVRTASSQKLTREFTGFAIIT